jgi:hypothetical protein
MSHILEEYAKNLGVLISKPIIAEHYFPIPEDKYITIYCESKIQSKSYQYYSLVFNLLAPILHEQNIKVIQIDCQNNAIEGVNKILGGLSFKQYASILSKSLLHVGVDNVYSHYVSSKNIPLVNVFGNTYPAISNGYWSKSDKKKDIVAPWEVKPCLNLQDPKSEINKIKPEKIAQSIIDLLKIPKRLNFKTIKVGELFNFPITEVIPTSFTPININKNELLFLRLDQGYDESAFLQYCHNYQVSIITDRLIQPSGLESIRHNVKKISLFIDKTSGDIDERYFEILKIWGIELQLITKKSEDLQYLKNKYFEHSVNLYNKANTKPEIVSLNNLFLSGKRVFENGIEYPSVAHWKAKQKSVDISMNVLDTPEYWEEQDHFYIYEQN